MPRVHRLLSSLILATAARALPSITALALATVIFTGAAAWGQNEPAPPANTDCAHICKDGFNTLLTDETQKKAFTACVTQNKCGSVEKLAPIAGPKLNPLLGPFQRF
jgi:hypothetical protein